MNVAICTPTAGSVKATYTASLIGMVGYYFGNPVPGLEDEPRAMSYNLLIGSNIAQQREEMVQDAIRDSATHVLFIDDDMGWEADCLNLALSRQVPIVLANYRRKAMPWAFTARRIDDQARAIEVPTDDLTLGLEAITFGGFGFCLIEVGILTQMKQPRFFNKWVEHQQMHSTEDYPFFQAIHDAGLAKVYVDHDLTKKVVHIGDYPYQWATAPFGVRVKQMPPPSEALQEFKAA